MQTQNPILDQVAKLMTEAAGAANGVKTEAETLLKRQAERLTAQMDLVSREEFEAVREMAALARAENEALRGALTALEERLTVLETAARAADASGDNGLETPSQ